jgi:hypothetical protein
VKQTIETNLNIDGEMYTTGRVSTTRNQTLHKTFVQEGTYSATSFHYQIKLCIIEQLNPSTPWQPKSEHRSLSSINNNFIHLASLNTKSKLLSRIHLAMQVHIWDRNVRTFQQGVHSHDTKHNYSYVMLNYDTNAKKLKYYTTATSDISLLYLLSRANAVTRYSDLK